MKHGRSDARQHDSTGEIPWQIRPYPPVGETTDGIRLVWGYEALSIHRPAHEADY